MLLKTLKLHDFSSICLAAYDFMKPTTKEPSKSFFAWFSLSNSNTTLSCTTVNKECINSLLNCTKLHYDKILSGATLTSESD